MAEAPPSEPVPSSSESTEPVLETEVADTKDDEGPSAKKRKMISERETSDKLEHRLGGILCCAVCLDLPQAAVYQVFLKQLILSHAFISCFAENFYWLSLRKSVNSSGRGCETRRRADAYTTIVYQ